MLPGEAWNFLDPVVLDAALRHRANTSFYEALLEARALLEPEAASLAAARATARQVALIEEAFLAMVESNSRDDEAWSRADLAFHTAIIEASGNWIYRHFASVIRAALLVTFRLTHRHTTSHGDVVAMHRDVLEAIRLRKPHIKDVDLKDIALARLTDGYRPSQDMGPGTTDGLLENLIKLFRQPFPWNIVLGICG